MSRINNFLNKHFDNWHLQALNCDASFRKYYRIYTNNKTFVLMDSNPEFEDNNKFITTQKILNDNKIKVPQIYFTDDNSLFVLEDFGDILFAHKQKNINLDLYKKAIDQIYNLQQIKTDKLKPYNKELLSAELNLCQQWYNSDFDYDSIFSFLLKNINTHNKVLVHRDYHSRNIMLMDKSFLGIIDFQDMVNGSYVYDLASLIKDVYIELTISHREALLRYFYQKFGLNDWHKFIYDFELIGVQRHLKILGIFSRLNTRDKKSQFLENIPLTRKYLAEMAIKYPELKTLKNI